MTREQIRDMQQAWAEFHITAGLDRMERPDAHWTAFCAGWELALKQKGAICNQPNPIADAPMTPQRDS